MNRAQRRSYMKLHEKDKRATYCDRCKFKTLSKMYTDADTLSTTHFICEICGLEKARHIRIVGDNTTHSAIYEERPL